MAQDIDRTIANDLTREIRDSQAQAAIQATCSRVSKAFDEIELLLQQGVNMVSIAEEMAWPAALFFPRPLGCL